jgi:hypothetical protein
MHVTKKKFTVPLAVRKQNIPFIKNDELPTPTYPKTKNS